MEWWLRQEQGRVKEQGGQGTSRMAKVAFEISKHYSRESHADGI